MDIQIEHDRHYSKQQKLNAAKQLERKITNVSKERR